MDTIRIEKLTLDDADLYYDVFDANRAHIAEHDERLAQEFMTISSVGEKLSSYHGKTNQHFGIIEDNEFIGSVALMLDQNRKGELSYWLDQNYTGRGIARQACRMLMNESMATLGVREFDAVIAPTNVASRRTVEGLQFQQTARFKDAVVYSRNLPRF